MPLAAGTHLGNYEILAPLGKGGMGEDCWFDELERLLEVQ
jgi:hypothetical protein